MTISPRVLTALALSALAVFAPRARADDPCAAFTWNVAHERALFAGAAQSVLSGQGVAAAPLLAPDRLYELSLKPQQQVEMALAPGKKSSPPADSHAGLVKLQVPAAGLYRIALSEAAWVDIVSAGQLIPSSDFTGQPGCSAPHKVVQFNLPAGELLLQLSAAASERVRLSLTHSPDAR
jgi:hypothetical protein